MMKKAAFAVVAVLLSGRVPARSQELTAGPLAATLAQIHALKSAPAAAAPAPTAAPETVSYSGMAQSFDSAPAAALDSLLGDWLEIAHAASPDEPGQYDPKGFPDWLYRLSGVEMSRIPAKPPIQDKDSFEIAWGAFGPATSGFAGRVAAELLFDAREGYVHVPGHFEDDTVICVNCSDNDPAPRHWVADATYEFRLVGAKNDFLLERKTSGGAVAYSGFSKR